MHEPRHSQAAVWICIGVLAASVVWAQAIIAIQRATRLDPARSGFVESPPARRPALERADAAPAGPLRPDPSDGQTAEWFLEAIVQVESAGDPSCVGQAGERGQMQIKESTWRETTEQVFGAPIPFSRAFEPELNREVGQAYLAYLSEYLRSNQARWQSDPRSLLAACYNVGPSRVLESGFNVRMLPRSTQQYAERVSSLHDYYLHESGIAPSHWFVRRADPEDRDS